MEMEIYRVLDTAQCYVTAWSTDQIVMGRRIYVVRSIRRSDGRKLVRFGNRNQIDAIMNAYAVKKDYTLRPEQS